MKVYDTQHIRNIALFGHAGSGKTTLTETLSLLTGAITRKGAVEEQNTISDYSDIEHERGGSLFLTPLYIEYNNFKINILDTPGFNDYIGEVIAAAKAADTGFILINAQNGMEVGAENGWHYCEVNSNPVVFCINKLDIDQANYDNSVEHIQALAGKSATPVQYPVKTGAGFSQIVDILKMKLLSFDDKGAMTVGDIPDSETERAEKMRGELIESIAETDEDLMNKYFEEGTLSHDEICAGFKKAFAARQIFPIFCLSGKNNSGAARILDFITDVCPSPLDLPPVITEEGKELTYDHMGRTVLFIYKLLSEAQTGEILYFKVMSGSLRPGTDLVNEQKSATERFNQIFIAGGKKRTEVDALVAGDIGATVKLKNTLINHTLHEKNFDVTIPPMTYPNPIVRTAVAPRTKGEEEKIGMGLNNIEHEDPSIHVEHSQELRQLILHAQGELQLGIVKWKLENKYKVATEFIEPRVPYRETIQKQVKGSYRHKKQSGGAGQFAEVHMMVEPWYEGMPDPAGLSVRGRDMYKLDWGGNLEFLNCIVGGVIDQRFLPAILKGVMDKMTFGPLTGSYVRDIRVTVFDGKMHPVDSNEAAFKTAGMMVFKANFIEAAPKILEPIYEVQIKVPEEYVGDVMSDLPTRRGMILGIDSVGRYQVIKARMPLAELDKYSTGLRSMTAGRATYTQKYVEYQSVPANVQQELIDAHKKHQTEDE
jgi:elongation factor G